MIVTSVSLSKQETKPHLGNMNYDHFLWIVWNAFKLTKFSLNSNKWWNTLNFILWPGMSSNYTFTVYIKLVMRYATKNIAFCSIISMKMLSVTFQSKETLNTLLLCCNLLTKWYRQSCSDSELMLSMKAIGSHQNAFRGKVLQFKNMQIIL